MYLTTGAVKQVRQTQRPLDQCFETAPTLCLQARSLHIVYTDLSLHECNVCGDLRMSRFHGQHCLEHDKTIKILNKTVTGLCGLLFQAILRGLETANGCLPPCVRTCSESESCFHGCMRTKAKISSDVLGPKNYLRSHRTSSSSKHFLGEHILASVYTHYNVCTRVLVPIRIRGTNAILLPLGL